MGKNKQQSAATTATLVCNKEAPSAMDNSTSMKHAAKTSSSWEQPTHYDLENDPILNTELQQFHNPTTSQHHEQQQQQQQSHHHHQQHSMLGK